MVIADPTKVQTARHSRNLTQDQLLERLHTKHEVEIELRTLQTFDAQTKARATGRVRQSVLQAVADELDLPYESLLADGQVPWWIPQPEWVEGRNSPGMLLQAEMAIVPFYFRKAELAALEDWCTNPSPLRIRVIHGRGGMGKTRLALEFCRRMREKLWRAGLLNYELFQPTNQQWDPLLAEPEKLLLVFDYAESRVEQIGWLLTKMGSTPAMKIRVLLLARHVGDWFNQLKSYRVCGDLLAGPASDEPHELRPVSMSLKDQPELYQAGGSAFAAKLGKPAPGPPPEDVRSELYEQVLLLHIRALAAVWDGQNPRDEEGILGYLLDRERRFWREQLLARGLDATLMVAVEEAMAGITANGGMKSTKDALEWLEVLPSLQGRPADVRMALNNLLSDCYPGDRWIEPVQPDLFGGKLFQVGLKSNPALKAAAFAEVRKAARNRKRDG